MKRGTTLFAEPLLLFFALVSPPALLTPRRPVSGNAPNKESVAPSTSKDEHNQINKQPANNTTCPLYILPSLFLFFTLNLAGLIRRGTLQKEIVHTDGSTYVGEVDSEDQPHGHGVYKWTNGDVYEGEWHHGSREGKGRCAYGSGNVYEGHWKDNQKDGKGKFTWESGDVYEGEWADDEQHGKGSYTYASGNSYDGHWKHDMKDGKGKFKWAASGNAYKGEWADDKPHGKGKFTNGADGRKVLRHYSSGQCTLEEEYHKDI
jgi:hypothetical protein